MNVVLTPLPKPRHKVSCTIIACNEADRIARTIASVQGLVGEIVVIDSGSSDGTQALCQRLGARVIHNDWPGFGPQKRFAEAACLNDLILNLDADEWLSDELRQELAQILAQETLPAQSFRMKMTFVYPRRDTPCLFADYHNYVRLYDRRVTRFANSLSHDEVPATQDCVQLKGRALHQSIRSLTHLVRKELDYYALQKREFARKKTWLAARVPFEFFLQFFKYYINRRHIFGGRYGLVVALVVAHLRWLRLLILLGW